MLGLGNSSTGSSWSWSPPILGSKLIHWYKFNSGITTNGTGVTQWADAVGTNHLAPTVTNDANEQPALESDGTIFFDQSTDSLVFDSALSLGKYSRFESGFIKIYSLLFGQSPL